MRACFLIVLLGLTNCAALETVDQLSREAVAETCAQSELSRKATRERLADWGLWVKCVPQGTLYDTLMLVESPPGF